MRPKDARSNKKITNQLFFFVIKTEKLVILNNVVWSGMVGVTHSNQNTQKNADEALSQHHTEWSLGYGFSSHIVKYLQKSEELVCRIKGFPTYLKHVLQSSIDGFFKLKRSSPDVIKKFKARLVAKGFSQRPGMDCNETYSPKKGQWVSGICLWDLVTLNAFVCCTRR